MIYQLNDIFDPEEKDIIADKVLRYSNDPMYPGWKLTGRSSNDPLHKQKPFWYLDIEDDPLLSKQIFYKIQKVIYEEFNEEVAVDRIYLNGATYGQHGYFHQDNIHAEEARTFLIYCNSEWHPHWGGATIFKEFVNKSKEEEGYSIETVYPVPFASVYFDGNLWHCSQPVSSDFPGLRVTLAYKLHVVSL